MWNVILNQKLHYWSKAELGPGRKSRHVIRIVNVFCSSFRRSTRQCTWTNFVPVVHSAPHRVDAHPYANDTQQTTADNCQTPFSRQTIDVHLWCLAWMVSNRLKISTGHLTCLGTVKASTRPLSQLIGRLSVYSTLSSVSAKWNGQTFRMIG